MPRRGLIVLGATNDPILMFFLFPVGVDFRTNRLPVVTFSLMGLCTAIFVIGVLLFLSQSSGGDELSDPIIERFGLIPDQVTPLAWFTHMFLHAGFFHLVGNMVYLFLFGAVVEDLIGRAKFLMFFLVGGLAAAAVHIVFSSPASAHIPMVGASGAISACLGAFVVLQARTHVEFRYFIWLVIPIFKGDFTLPSYVVIAFWFISDLIGLVLDTMDPSRQAGVAFGAHVGGMVAGLVMISGHQAMIKAKA